jgi:excisionase family DNA binding protein
MEMTRPEALRKIDLAGQPHYLVDDAARLLHKHRRTVIRWMDEGKLTRVHYDTRAVCIPAAEVDELRAELEDGNGSGGNAGSGPPNKPGDGPPRGDAK